VSTHSSAIGNIALIGYRGTGKSTIAAHLGRSLGWPVFALDAEIVRDAGMSIVDLVAARGWDYFRDLEQRLLANAVDRAPRIIDCGGGVVERDANHTSLRRCANVVWLRASPETLLERLAHDQERPALTEGRTFLEEIGEVLTRRSPLYAKLATIVVDTEGLTPESLAVEILGRLRLDPIPQGDRKRD